MWKYIRLLRLQDQHVEVSAVLAASIFMGVREPFVLWWALAVVYLSVPAYIINELVDAKDADRYSWNTKIHIRRSDKIDRRAAIALSVFLSVFGLSLSWSLGYFRWGAAILVIGILYSLEPIRLKRWPVVDLAAQVLSFWILPFLAVTWGRGNPDLMIAFLILTVSAIISMLLPYQVTDISADEKAGLHGTHVVLGLKNSLFLGFLVGLFSVFSFILFDVYRWAPWITPFILFVPLTLWLYIRWMRMGSGSKQLDDMRHWVGIVKPLQQIIVVYLFLLWRFF